MEYPKTFATNEQKSWLVPADPSLKKVKEEPRSGSGQTNLIINYLPSDMTADELFEMFAQIGEVVKHKIVRDRRSGQSLGYGFVEFENENVAKLAQIMWDRQKLRGKILKVAFARPRSEDIVNANLYVAYLPPDFDEEKLSTLFGYYGTIIEVKVLRSKMTGQPRGAGFVRFDQHMAAQLAMNALDKHIPEGAKRPISVQWANGPINASKKEHCCCCSRGVQVTEDPNATIGPVKRYMEPEMQQVAKRYCGYVNPREG